MKKILLSSVLVLLVIVAANAQTVSFASHTEPRENVAIASFEWSETTHDFGEIVKSKPVTAEFAFTNNGSVPLVIAKVKGSCGCTVTDYPKQSIAPGKSGIIKATYNAAVKGAFTKSVTVTANTNDGPVKLLIKGEVIEKQI